MARFAVAWQRLVEEGWFSSRSDAERWILSGKVRAGTTPVTTTGQRIPADAPLTVYGIDRQYVSKGGLKLVGALQDFAIDVNGRTCIDAGASTGGFTDCLLQHGAAHVYAVDVGYGQLAGSLRAHTAVHNMERTNVGDDILRTLTPRPTLGTVDLSYLSLRKAVPLFAAILHGHGDLVCLVKPLFEIDDAAARRSGIIPPDAYAPLLEQLSDGLSQDGFPIAGVTHSPVTGNTGTLEFFFHINLDQRAALPSEDRSRQITQAVQAAQSLPFYKTAKEPST